MIRIVFIVLRILLFVFLPAVFVYLGSERNIIDVLKQDGILGDNLDVSYVKQLFLILSVSISNLILVVLYEINNHKNKATLSKNVSLINDFKASFLLSLATELNEPKVHSIKFRVWREPNKMVKMCGTIKSWIKRQPNKKILKMINVKGLSDTDTTKGLHFEIYPSLQGLVGKCYNERTILYEEDVSGQNELYNLTKYQISKTRSTKFCICFPIFNKEDRVVTIISMDSMYNIQIPSDLKEEAVANLVTIFSQDLSKYFPKLFK